MFFSNPIKEQAIYFIANLQIFHMTLSEKVLSVYAGLYLFIVLFYIFSVILTKYRIEKFRKYVLWCIVLIMFSPIGFLYHILYALTVDYAYDYLKYKNYSYQQIFKIVKNTNYVERENVKILNPEEKHKNLVLIFLESYERNLLTNKEVSKYTVHINNLSKEGEFYTKLPQLEGSLGTFNGIFTVLCGSRNYNYSLFKNPYKKISQNHHFSCVPDILHKANYKQIFIGGANKLLFNKSNLILSHNYDIMEDRESLIKQYPDLKDKLNEWGVADIDVFNIAKEKYVELSKNNVPFNLTILTTATHNVNGVPDKRCKNSSKDNDLLNAVECTDNNVNDFIDFLKTQPNYKDTIIIILPDHVQYNVNGLNDIIKDETTDLFTIVLNTNVIKKFTNTIDYTDLAEIILNRLNVKSNANFLNNPKDTRLIKNFIHKVHFE